MNRLVATLGVAVLLGLSSAASANPTVNGAAAGAVGGAVVAGPVGLVVGGIGGAVVGSHYRHGHARSRAPRRHRRHH